MELFFIILYTFFLAIAMLLCTTALCQYFFPVHPPVFHDVDTQRSLDPVCPRPPIPKLETITVVVHHPDDAIGVGTKTSA